MQTIGWKLHQNRLGFWSLELLNRNPQKALLVQPQVQPTIITEIQGSWVILFEIPQKYEERTQKPDGTSETFHVTSVLDFQVPKLNIWQKTELCNQRPPRIWSLTFQGGLLQLSSLPVSFYCHFLLFSMHGHTFTSYHPPVSFLIVFIYMITLPRAGKEPHFPCMLICFALQPT